MLEKFLKSKQERRRINGFIKKANEEVVSNYIHLNKEMKCKLTEYYLKS